MKPKAATPQRELFGAQLCELLNPMHPLYVLAERIDWPEFDAAIDACYAADIGSAHHYRKNFSLYGCRCGVTQIA